MSAAADIAPLLILASTFRLSGAPRAPASFATKASYRPLSLAPAGRGAVAAAFSLARPRTLELVVDGPRNESTSRVAGVFELHSAGLKMFRGCPLPPPPGGGGTYTNASNTMCEYPFCCAQNALFFSSRVCSAAAAGAPGASPALCILGGTVRG